MRKGTYQHFKGEFYRVIDIAYHSESLEKYVIYHNIKNNDKLWIRPLTMFTEVIERDNIKIDRFKFISDE